MERRCHHRVAILLVNRRKQLLLWGKEEGGVDLARQEERVGLPPATSLKLAAVASAPLMFYAAFTLLSTFSFNPFRWLVTELGVFLSHVWYGVQFMRGLCARRAPCEFIGKDHA